MTSSSPIEKALERVSASGWLLKSLSKSPFNNQRPWSCELYPGHFGGSYFAGTINREGYTRYYGGMTTIIADGETACEAIHTALEALDKSDAKAVYESLEIALEDWLDAATQTVGDRRRD